MAKLSAAEWAEFSENAHLAVFGTIKPASMDRIHYAILAVDMADVPVGYVTVRELDPDTVYWQFGGVFDHRRGSHLVPHVYREMLKFQSRFAKRMTTYIENTNTPMLKLALSEGLKPIGVRIWGNETLVEMAKEWTDGDR